jgi:hypothetical protein
LQAVGSEPIESYTVEQKPEALHAWVAQLQARFPQGRIALALEQSRGAVIYALMNYAFLQLYPVPPQGLARYRQAFFTSGAALGACLLRAATQAGRFPSRRHPRSGLQMDSHPLSLDESWLKLRRQLRKI